MIYCLISSTKQLGDVGGQICGSRDFGLATEKPREEPTCGGCLFVALALLSAWDVLHDLVHMLAAARPCCLPANSAGDCSAHVVFPFNLNALFQSTIPPGV